MSLSVQSRAASSSAIQARDGVAVSMAIASFVVASARMWTFVAAGPTTRVMCSMTVSVAGRRSSANRPGPVLVQKSGLGRLELGLHALERLADHLVGRALDHPRADACERARQVDVRDPVHDGPAVAVIGQLHARVRVDGAAGRLAVRLDDRAIGRFELRELHVDVEPGADEPDSDLGRGLEMRVVDDLDRLDTGAALTDLLGVDDERPDLVAGRLDRNGAFEMHGSSRVPGSVVHR